MLSEQEIEGLVVDINTSLEDATKQAGVLRTKIKNFDEETDDLGHSIADLARQVDQMSIALGNIEDGLSMAVDAMKELTRHLGTKAQEQILHVQYRLTVRDGKVVRVQWWNATPDPETGLFTNGENK